MRPILTCPLFPVISISHILGLVALGHAGGIEDVVGGSASRVQLVGSAFGDSEDFVHRCGRLRAGFSLTQNMSIQGNTAWHRLSQDGSEFTGRGVSILLGEKLGSAWEAKLGVGLTDYQTIGKDISYLASLEGKPTQTGHLTLAYGHDNVVYDVKNLEALRAGIVSHQLSPSFYQWISEKWSFWGRLTLGRYSDRNLKTSLDASLTYLLRLEPQLSLSYGFGYLTYRERSDLYWDPDGYLGHYLISGLSQSLGDVLSVNLRGSIGFSPSESKVNSGLSVDLSLHHSPRWGLHLTGEYVGEPGRGENYSFANSSLSIVWLP